MTKEELREALNALTRNSHRLQRRINAKDVRAERHISIDSRLVEAVLHPSRREDS